MAAEPGRGGKPSNFDKLKPEAIELSGIRGIASRHGYRVETIGLSLFNLTEDVGEQHNLADKHPEIVEQLQREVESARADLGDILTNRKPRGARPAGDIRSMP